jgi:type IV pilus assembly protein PilN
MIPINLLPHREERRRAQRRQFAVLAGGTLGVGVLVVILVHGWFVGQLSFQQGRNQFLRDEIATLDRQIDEIKKLKDQISELTAKKGAVETLQSNRSEAVRLLDQLVRQLPDGVYLKTVKQTGEKVNISGYATSNARVSTLMRNLEASPWLEQPNLVEIKAATVDKQTVNEFNLNVLLTREKPPEPDKAGGAAKPGASAAAKQG